MKLFITGGSGFVGKSLIKELVKGHHEIYCLARSEKAIQLINNLGANPVSGNLLAVQEFKNKLKGIDAIVHSGAKIKFVGDLDEFYGVNVKATRELIDSAIEAKVKKFIYISAAAIALDGKPLIEITEEYQPKSMIKSNYLKSKLLAESEILKRNKEIQVIILRPPVVWGEGMGIMNEFRNTITKIGFPTIGDPLHHLATCHIQNLITAILLSLKNNEANGVFLVNDNEKVEVREFMRKLIKGYTMEMGNLRIPKKMALLTANFLEFIWKTFSLKGNPPMTSIIVHIMGNEFSIDDTKARRILGYKPTLSVEEGLHQLSQARK